MAGVVNYLFVLDDEENVTDRVRGNVSETALFDCRVPVKAAVVFCV